MTMKSISKQIDYQFTINIYKTIKELFMNRTHIINATSIIEYADKKFLFDPMLGEKGSFASFPDAPGEGLENPLVDLPISLEDIIKRSEERRVGKECKYRSLT